MEGPSNVGPPSSFSFVDGTDPCSPASLKARNRIVQVKNIMLLQA